MKCSLDLVNAVCYLAFIDPKEAIEMQFSTEYLFARISRLQEQEDIKDLLSSDDYSFNSSSSFEESIPSPDSISALDKQTFDEGFKGGTTIN